MRNGSSDRKTPTGRETKISTSEIRIPGITISHSARGERIMPSETKIRICISHASPSKNFSVLCRCTKGLFPITTPAQYTASSPFA